MSIQQFIEANHGKDFGDTFLYDGIRVMTRRHRNCPSSLYEVGFQPFPDYWYSDCIDTAKMDNRDGELISFYNWLKTVFFPGSLKR